MKFNWKYFFLYNLKKLNLNIQNKFLDRTEKCLQILASHVIGICTYCVNVTCTYHVIAKVQITRTEVSNRKVQKYLWLPSPTQVSSQGQWWSCFRTHCLQSSQCLLLIGCCHRKIVHV